MLRLAADGIVGFSSAPLRLGIGVGVFMAIAAVGYGIVAIALKLAGLPYVPGYASLLVTITFLSGIQLIIIGVIGLYLARVYDEVRGRPLYLVREASGFTVPSVGTIGTAIAEEPSADGARSSASVGVMTPSDPP
jgi:polyisoprenyl-phosphate glycosyltransferase